MNACITHRDIAQVIEEIAPLRLQEQWDNSGFQVGNPAAPCTGVLLCVDVTEAIVDEAVALGCSMIVSHHPVLFRGIKQVLGRNRVERVLAKALASGITIYSGHTSVDNAPAGVSHVMAQHLGLTGCRVLAPADPTGTTGCGIVGELPDALSAKAFVELVKATFNSPVVRCSDPALAPAVIKRVALCGGAGGDFIADAISAGAQAYINSDTKLNQFIDNDSDIFLVDIGHYESENCTKEIFYRAISEKFPKFALYYSVVEKNPIHYL